MVEIIVPESVDPENVEVWLDGKRTSAQSTPEGRLAIAVPGDSAFPRHQLEVLYHCEAQGVNLGNVFLELPRIARNTWAHRTYLQLVLPRNAHLVAAPAGFTSEFSWGWNGMFWGRQPAMEQSQLETWSGARHFTELSAETNRYLFSTLGTVAQCQVTVADRATIVLVASGLALVIGLAVIYVPACRHPVALLAVAILLAAATILAPDLALLAAQAAGLGILLAICAGLLRRSGARRRRSLWEPPSSVFDRSSRTVPRSAAADRLESTQIKPSAALDSIPNPSQ